MWYIAMALLVLTMGCSLGVEAVVLPSMAVSPHKVMMADGGVDVVGRLRMLKGTPTDDEEDKAFPGGRTERGYEIVELEVERHLEYLEEKYGTNYRNVNGKVEKSWTTKVMTFDGSVDQLGRIEKLKGKPTKEEMEKAFPGNYAEYNYKLVKVYVEKHLEYLEEKYGTTYWDEE